MLKIYTVEEANKTILDRSSTFEFGDMTDAQKAFSTRIYGEPLTPAEGVRHILRDVRQRGEEGVQTWTRKLDGGELFAVNRKQFAEAKERIEPELLSALEFAAERIRAFHALQPLPNWTTDALGGTLGQRVTPIERVGVYVPGGTAPLPSSLLMAAIPARVAGVREIVAVTPPDKDGNIPDVILAAAAVAGVDELYAVGGAQAIGALAFGTETIKRVDKVVGAGGLYTTLAKREVYGIVGIDGIYGPTETVVVADDSADPEWIAADLIAQAEHDVLATAILFTPSQTLADAVQVEIGRQVEERSRAAIIAQSLAAQSGIVMTADLAEACALASDFAAEHTCIATENPEQWIDSIPNAGGLFVGERSFEVLGDYVAGPSHIMPTGATARFASPVNVMDFVKISSVVMLDDASSAELSPIAARIALAEGLDGHANAARFRVANRPGGNSWQLS